MGILEDAIREHLELKRKHGADPTEVAKQEREALSPATREATAAVETVEPGAAAEAGLAEAGFADPALAPGEPGVPELTGPPAGGLFDFESDGPVEPEPPAPGEELFTDTAAEHDLESGGAAYPADAPPAAFEPPPAPAAAAAPPPPQAAPPPAPEPPAPPAEEQAAGPGETVAFDADELFEAEDSAAEPEAPPPPAGSDPPTGDNDVLEQTPDFLEETPDHDRLWFEQKPPRDFDF